MIVSVGERQNRENWREESSSFESLMLQLTGGTRDKNKRNGVKRLEKAAINWKGRERDRKGTEEGEREEQQPDRGKDGMIKSAVGGVCGGEQGHS